MLIKSVKYEIYCQSVTVEWRCCKCWISWLWPTFSRSNNLKCEYLENGEPAKMLKNDFYKGWYLPSNGPLRLVYSMTLTIIFKVKHFLVMHCYKTMCRQWMNPADLPRLTRPLTMELLLFYCLGFFLILTNMAPSWCCCCSTASESSLFTETCLHPHHIVPFVPLPRIHPYL